MLTIQFATQRQFIYTCSMRNSLKNLFSEQIKLEDGTEYFFTTKPFELTNTLGQTVAVLQEYHFTKKGIEQEPFEIKLYKTKDGNWYDKDELPSANTYPVLRALKTAVDCHENRPQSSRISE